MVRVCGSLEFVDMAVCSGDEHNIYHQFARVSVNEAADCFLCWRKHHKKAFWADRILLGGTWKSNWFAQAICVCSGPFCQLHLYCTARLSHVVRRRMYLRSHFDNVSTGSFSDALCGHESSKHLEQRCTQYLINAGDSLVSQPFFVRAISYDP